MIRWMRRISLTALTLLSLAVVVFWIRSASHEDQIMWSVQHRFFLCVDSRNLFVEYSFAPGCDSTHLLEVCSFGPDHPWDYTCKDPWIWIQYDAPIGDQKFAWRTAKVFTGPSLADLKAGVIIIPTPAAVNGRVVRTPHWVPLLAFALAPLAWVCLQGFRRRRRQMRLHRHLCSHCGYDLRAHQSGEKCPECGTPIPPPPPTLPF